MPQMPHGRRFIIADRYSSFRRKPESRPRPFGLAAWRRVSAGDSCLVGIRAQLGVWRLVINLGGQFSHDRRWLFAEPDDPFHDPVRGLD